TLPMDFQSELTVTRHYTPRQYGFTFTNGIQASYVELDPDTGMVKLLKHWCVEDAGTIINPLLVDEQIRGGVVQGIGAALFEECVYGPDGQLLNGNLADYLVPMAGEIPGGLSRADGGRDARHHLRAPGNPDEAVAARREGRGRGGHRRRARRGHERHQRRARAARRARDRDAVHPGKNPHRTEEGLMAKDARLQSAISHWAPRFVSNGVLLADFEEVTGGLERWDDWCAAWSKRAALHEALGRKALDGHYFMTAGEHYARAAMYYDFAKFVFVQDIEQM